MPKAKVQKANDIQLAIVDAKSSQEKETNPVLKKCFVDVEAGLWKYEKPFEQLASYAQGDSDDHLHRGHILKGLLTESSDTLNLLLDNYKTYRKAIRAKTGGTAPLRRFGDVAAACTGGILKTCGEVIANILPVTFDAVPLSTPPARNHLIAQYQVETVLIACLQLLKVTSNITLGLHHSNDIALLQILGDDQAIGDSVVKNIHTTLACMIRVIDDLHTMSPVLYKTYHTATALIRKARSTASHLYDLLMIDNVEQESWVEMLRRSCRLQTASAGLLLAFRIEEAAAETYALSTMMQHLGMEDLSIRVAAMYLNDYKEFRRESEVTHLLTRLAICGDRPYGHTWTNLRGYPTSMRHGHGQVPTTSTAVYISYDTLWFSRCNEHSTQDVPLVSQRICAVKGLKNPPGVAIGAKGPSGEPITLLCRFDGPAAIGNAAAADLLQSICALAPDEADPAAKDRLVFSKRQAALLTFRVDVGYELELRDRGGAPSAIEDVVDTGVGSDDQTGAGIEERGRGGGASTDRSRA